TFRHDRVAIHNVEVVTLESSRGRTSGIVVSLSLPQRLDDPGDIRPGNALICGHMTTLPAHSEVATEAPFDKPLEGNVLWILFARVFSGMTPPEDVNSIGAILVDGHSEV